MFGNPNISNTPVDDLYASQADVYGNSFANPVNPANMNSGWGIDPSLLSPSYTSSYRPSYSGGNGAIAGGRPGFFGGLNNLAPWSNTPRWGNPDDHHQPSVDSVASRPVDASMWAAQRIAMPVAAVRGAGMVFGGYNGWGMGKGAVSMGRNLGRGFGAGLARGIGAGGGGLIARGMAAGMGGIGAAALGWGLPMAVAQGAMWAGEKAVFDPYINTRRSAENLRDNFSGITFGDSQGNVSNYGGLSGAESSRMGRQITTAGIKDMSLSTGEYGAAANMIGRSGLTDNVNSKDIVKRIKDSTEQMKLIMNIAAMPEMKDAIEQLSKLQRMGANVSGGSYSDAASTMRQLGGMASVAGTNVQKLMNTVGAQGQYLYQANGMTPHMGQLAAASSYAALSVGNRQGLISSAQLARLGGLDGATQATLTGELNASQTTYNKIANYNKYMGAGRSGSTLGNLAQFGQSMSRDPMATQGAMQLYGNVMASNQMGERGSLALDDQVWDMLKNMPNMVGKDGKISLEKAVPYLTQMGMSNDQIMAYASKRVSETDTGAFNTSMRGLNRNLIEQQKQFIEQNNMYGGTFGRGVHSAMKFGRNVTAAIGDATGGAMASVEGSLRDAVGMAKDDIWYGSTIKNSGQSVEDVLNGTDSTKTITGFDLNTLSAREYAKKNGDNAKNGERFGNIRDVTTALNDAKDKGNPHAIAYFQATNAKDKQAALNSFKENGGMSRRANEYYSDPTNYKNIVSDLDGVARGSMKNNSPSLGDVVKNTMEAASFGLISFDEPEKVKETGANLLERVGGIKGGDLADNARTAGRAYEAMTRDYSGKSLGTSNIESIMAGDDNIQAFAKARGLTDPQDILKALQTTSKSVVDNRLVGLTTNSLKVKGSGADAIKAAAARGNNQFYDENAIDTSHYDLKETLDSSMAMKEHKRMQGQMTDLYKSGHLDFKGFQDNMSALENRKAIGEFVKGVNTFVKKIDDMPAGKDSIGGGFLGLFSSKDGGGNQNVIGKK